MTVAYTLLVDPIKNRIQGSVLPRQCIKSIDACKRLRCRAIHWRNCCISGIIVPPLAQTLANESLPQIFQALNESHH